MLVTEDLHKAAIDTIQGKKSTKCKEKVCSWECASTFPTSELMVLEYLLIVCFRAHINSLLINCLVHTLIKRQIIIYV